VSSGPRGRFGAVSEAAVEAVRLEKWFGPIPALRDVSFSLERGTFLTIFGPNGAGKSTLLRVLSAATRPSGGEGRILGHPVGSGAGAWRERLGVLSHRTFLYGDLTARENLTLYGRLYRVPDLADRVEVGLDEFGLARRGDDRVGGFSHGMRQRLALARTLLHDPEVVFLDEPYTGLDPHAARVLRRTLERLRDGERTVLLVTHNLAEGLELADRTVIQVGGRWVHDAPRDRTSAAAFADVYTDRVAEALA